MFHCTGSIWNNLYLYFNFRIEKEGSIPKFVKKVRSISFSAKRAIKNGQKVLFITERCVFRLTPNGLKLIEVYPGVDAETQILQQLPFKVEL